MRQRAVLRFLLFAKKMDRSSYIFSHFDICRHLSFVLVRIFFYFIPWSFLLKHVMLEFRDREVYKASVNIEKNLKYSKLVKVIDRN